MDNKSQKQKVLFLSDTHIGAKISKVPEYQEQLIETMARYDHVCMAGDCWELFYIGKHHVQHLSNMLEVLGGKDRREWQKEFNKDESAKSGVKNVIHSAEWFVQEFLAKNPKVHLHVVGGNHESVRRFHNTFDAMQQEMPNRFQWSPEAIQLGDTFMTHGHLPMDKTTLEESDFVRLSDAESKRKWTNILHRFQSPEQEWQERNRGAKTASAMVIEQLGKWDKSNKFHVSVWKDGSSIYLPLDLDTVKHVLFGHTHVKFFSHHHKPSGKILHNTGAMVEATEHVGPGLIEATLNADGTMTDFKPVELRKDHVIHIFADHNREVGGKAPKGF